MAENSEPHVLFFPFPGQGHLTPMLKLAQLISSYSGFYTTFLLTQHIHSRLLNHSPSVLTAQTSRLPKFRVQSIPDGLPEDDPRPFLKFMDLEESMWVASRKAYRELLMPEEEDPDGWPRVSCVVADGILRVGLEAAEEVGIPVMLLRTSSACSLWAYCSIPRLIELGEVPFPEDGNLDEMVQGMEGAQGIVRRRDLPSLMRNAKSTTENGIKYANTFSSNLTRAKALILNTFESLESPVLAQVRSVCPVTYTLGPLHVLARNVGLDCLSSDSSPSLWQEDRACIKWLDSQPHRSVVYASFGSSLVMSQEDLVEFWHGLVNCSQPFMWVVRPDLIKCCYGESNMISTELEEETRKRGCLVGWAPQEEVLANPAVACFLTHSGWNSTMESIVSEVPMICWPFFLDQMMNSRYVSEVWKIGVDMKDIRGRDVVRRMVREVMEEERAVELRKSVSAVAEAAKRSAEKGGTSFANLEKLIQHIKSLSLRSKE